MRYLRNYKSFHESIQIDVTLINIDINESLGMFYDSIMKSIGAQELNFFDTFKLSKQDFAVKLNLDLLTTNPDFVHTLTTNGLRKSNVTSTEDFETFLNKPCKFMLIHKSDLSELENPLYILFQSWNESLSKWEDLKVFKITGNIKDFYDKLSSKIVEIDDNGEKYIYSTSNGNEWNLDNIDKESDVYQRYFRTPDFEKLINDRKVKLNII